MKLLTAMTVDMGRSDERAGTVEQQSTLTPPFSRGPIGVSAQLSGDAASVPRIELFDGTVLLGEVQGFQTPLGVVLPSVRPLIARVTWKGWANNVDLTVRFFAGMPVGGSVTIPNGRSQALGPAQVGLFTLGAGQQTRLSVQGSGRVDIRQDGRLLRTIPLTPEQVADSVLLSGPGLFSLEPQGGAGTPFTVLRTDQVVAPPAPGLPPSPGTPAPAPTPGAPVPPPPPPPPALLPPELLTLDFSDLLELDAGVTERLAFDVPAGGVLRARAAAQAGRLTATLQGPDGTTLVQAQGVGRLPLDLIRPASGRYVLALTPAADTAVDVEIDVARPAGPGEYLLSSSGEHHGFVLDLPAGQRLGVRLSRPEGARDRPLLLVQDLAGNVLAQTGYHAALDVPSGPCLVYAEYAGMPYTDVTLFLSLSPP